MTRRVRRVQDPATLPVEPEAEAATGPGEEGAVSATPSGPAGAGPQDAVDDTLGAGAADGGAAADLGTSVATGAEAVAPSEPKPAPEPAPEPEPEPEPDFGPDPLAEGRPAALRLAALHLRTGQHALARAELEALAGRGRLDEGALLDLAEIRWRTGDLTGAGEAARALLARGHEAPLALVIAAEAVSEAGRPVEARRLSARALEVADGPLEPLFAGMPRAMIWPVAPAPETPSSAPRRSRGRRAVGHADGAPSTASEAFAGGRAALARGDPSRAALLLGVALRLEPGFAEDVLRALAGRDDQPQLALVRGDALRLLGREAEALEAFDRARGRSSGPGAAANGDHDGPGLFDLDEGPGA